MTFNSYFDIIYIEIKERQDHVYYNSWSIGLKEESEDIMKKNVFKIDDLCGGAWDSAIRNVYKILNENIGLENLDLKEAMGYEEIAKELNIKFNVNGNII